MTPEILEVQPVPNRARPEFDRELELLAHWMDSAFQIPRVGLRFGLDAIIGLIPGVGDTITSVVSLYILRAASRYGVPRITLLRMAMNIGLDYVLGAIPLVGDAFDVYWKANSKNAALLRRHFLTTPHEEQIARRGDWLVVAGLSVLLIALLIGSVTLAYYLAIWVGGILLHHGGGTTVGDSAAGLS